MVRLVIPGVVPTGLFFNKTKCSSEVSIGSSSIHGEMEGGEEKRKAVVLFENHAHQQPSAIRQVSCCIIPKELREDFQALKGKMLGFPRLRRTRKNDSWSAWKEQDEGIFFVPTAVPQDVTMTESQELEDEPQARLAQFDWADFDQIYGDLFCTREDSPPLQESPTFTSNTDAATSKLSTAFIPTVAASGDDSACSRLPSSRFVHFADEVEGRELEKVHEVACFPIEEGKVRHLKPVRCRVEI